MIITIIIDMNSFIQRRSTNQKRAILEGLRVVKTHPSAEELFTRIKRIIPALSLGTVYRNLRLLRDEGSIIELTCGKYACRYDGDVNPHSHFFCLICGHISDVAISAAGNLEKDVAAQTKGAVRYYRLIFYGECQDCKK